MLHLGKTGRHHEHLLAIFYHTDARIVRKSPRNIVQARLKTVDASYADGQC